MVNFDGAFSGRPVILRLVVRQDSQNISGNYSNCAFALEAIKTGNTTAWSSEASAYQVNINGNAWSGTWTYNFNGGIGQAIQIRGWTGFTVGHNSDGTKTISCSAAAQAAGYLGNANCSGSMGLTTIPRATTPSFTNPMTIGTAYTIDLPRASSGFTHTVQYFFGDASGQMGTGLGTSVVWTPPLSLLQEIPSAASGTGHIRVITYSGGTQIGVKDKSLTLNAPASAVPDFTTITHSEATAGLAANVGAYVQGLTKLALAITGAVGYQGSTIKSYKIEVGGQTVNAVSGTTPGPILSSGTVQIKGTITDSRGRTAIKTVNITVLAYVPPTINEISAVRSDGAGVPDEQGAYLRVNINAVVQSLIVTTQRNALNYKIYTRARGVSTWTLKDTTTPGGVSFNGAEAIGTYSIETAYDVLVEVYDDFMTSAFQLTVPTAAIFMHWDGRDGVGIGKYRQYGSLDVIGDIYARDGLISPPGAITAYAGTTAPQGWFLCDGQAISRTAYAALFDIIGITYGAGDGTTTFNLPNLKGRVPVGLDSTQPEFDAIAETGGAKTNTHNHYTTVSNDGTNTLVATSGNVPRSRVVTKARVTLAGANINGSTREDSTYDETIDVLQPYLVLNYIIRA